MLLQRTININLLLLLLLFFTSTTMTSAYQTGPVWPNDFTSYVDYSIDPNFNSKMPVTNATSIVVNNTFKWDNASLLEFYNASNWPNGNTITTANFQNPQTVPCPVTDTLIAATCLNANPTTITRVRTYFNTSPTITWNGNGLMSCSPRKADLSTVTLHELGHWLNLADGPSGHPEAVMNYQCGVAKQVLPEDDKRGVHQLYGPFDSWETTALQGEINRITYGPYNVAGYNNSSLLPERYPVSPEYGVPLISGAKYDHIAGYAKTGAASVYFTIAHDEQDSATNKTYFTIRPNMYLVWDQYNYQQSSVSVDFAMTDETRLQNSSLTDQNGKLLAPKYRHVYATGVWHTFEVNLTSLAGKKVRRWMYGYDNSLTGLTGNFRTYFDNLRIEYRTGT